MLFLTMSLFHTVSLIVSVLQEAWRRNAKAKRKPSQARTTLHDTHGLGKFKERSSSARGVHYQPRLQYPLLRYLPHFLATFLVENLAEALNIPEPPAIQPQQSFYTDNTGKTMEHCYFQSGFRRCLDVSP
jgi:hypothetical protein